MQSHFYLRFVRCFSAQLMPKNGSHPAPPCPIMLKKKDTYCSWKYAINRRRILESCRTLVLRLLQLLEVVVNIVVPVADLHRADHGMEIPVTDGMEAEQWEPSPISSEHCQHGCDRGERACGFNLSRGPGDVEPLVNARVDGRWSLVFALGDAELAGVGAVSAVGDGGIDAAVMMLAYARGSKSWG